MDYTKTHLTQAFINLDNLTHNMILLQKLVGNRPLWPAIKANAYGHDAEIIGRHLTRLGYAPLCVAHIDEAVELIEKGLDTRFIVLSPTLPENSRYFVQYGLEPVVCTLDQVSTLAEVASKPVTVHLKVDTGMGRVGIQPDQVVRFLEECARFPQITVRSMMSHFPRADESDKSFSRHQIERFSQVVEKTKAQIPIYHFANSAAIFDLPQAHFDAARPGISIYGLKPSLTMTNPEVNDLRPVLSWKTRITFLKEAPEGIGLSYGHAYHTERPSLIASIPLGYGDGMSRLLSNRLEMLVQGVRCRQVGRICMDQCLLDVTDLRGKVVIGDEVVIIGKQGDEEVTADELAETLGTINYEIVTNIAKRVPRITVGGTSLMNASWDRAT